MAAIALFHGINANLVHKWPRHSAGELPTFQCPTFLPVPLPPAARAPAPDISIELRRGTTSATVSWPLAAAEQCAIWMRELLK